MSMSYESVDQLQKVLTDSVFYYAKDSKKAAGRALGTIVEIITFYFLKSWGLNDFISIEKSLTEYGNPDIAHNVEYSLHPVLNRYSIEIDRDGSSVTANKIIKSIESRLKKKTFQKKNNNLLSKNGLLRNGCTIATGDKVNFVASISKSHENKYYVTVCEQHNNPFAIFECKRVGVEEGMRKGPQTIEKAKQGAYVARTISSLQKVRLDSGELYGIIYKDKNIPYSKPYNELLDEIIYSNDSEYLKKFILTVGVVSNHGNWFTSNNHNKELKVLAQSYDWLLFLTDSGLTEFISELILEPASEREAIRNAFLASYGAGKTKNQFTKVQMNYIADNVLHQYFSENLDRIQGWFNIISPRGCNILRLKKELFELKSKAWENIH